MTQNTISAHTVIAQMQVDLSEAIELVDEVLTAMVEVMGGTDYADQREWPDRYRQLLDAKQYYMRVTHSGQIDDHPVVVSDPDMVTTPGSEPCR